jgi:capping protein (actin filament) muscle Z-line, alpha
VRALLGDDELYEAATAEAFPEYNKAHLVSLELPDRSGDVSASLFRFPFRGSLFLGPCSYI